MRARTGEIQIVVTRMLVGWAEVSQLSDVVTKPMCGTLHQVVALTPGKRREVDLEFDMRFEIGNSNRCQSAENMLTCFISDRGPILFAIFGHMPHRDDANHGVFSLRCHGWVK